LIKYQVNTEQFKKHYFDICLTISKPNSNGIRLSLPTWIAGSYLIRDFAKHIVSIKATENNKPLNITQLDKNHWQIEPCRNEVNIYYQVYAFDCSVRSAFLDENRGFFNGSALLLSVDGEHNNTHQIEVKPQEGWQIYTTLTKIKKNLFEAETYEELIDCPVEMSKANCLDFKVNNIPHSLVLSGKHTIDDKRIIKDLIKICKHHHSFFGDSPFKKYLFLLLVTHNNYGGLEYSNSTSLICARDDLPQKHIKNITPEYTRLLGLLSHEYFHAWWVKKIKPKVFHNPNFNKEVYTEQLWIFEGWTSYYDELTLLRTKLLSLEEYLKLFGETITRVQQTLGRHNQSLVNSSFETWTKFYQQNENSINSGVSYYSKGALLAFVLDIQIREKTNDKLSLDDVLHHLWENYQDGLEDNTAQKVISELTNNNFDNFFKKYLYGTEDLPLKESFAYLGLDLTFVKPKTQKNTLGIFSKEEQGFIKITSVLHNSPAELSGLSVNDLIIAIDDIKVDFSQLEKTLNRYESGTKIVITVFRDNELRTFRAKLTTASKNICKISYLENISEKQKEHLNNWV